MTDREKDCLFYVCSLIEYTARKTLNQRGAVVCALGEDGIRRQLQDAEVNHCISFEQVSDEIIADYGIENGDFDTITSCRYPVPGFLDIGRLYSIIIEHCADTGKELETLIGVFTSFLSDEISNFKTGLYYQNPDYLEWSYREGYLLD